LGLHIPSIKSQECNSKHINPARLRKDLEDIVKELEPIVASHIDSSMASVVTVQCTQCQDYIVANVEGLKKSKKAVCLNTNCAAEFFVTEGEEGNFYFQLMSSWFSCMACKTKKEVENRKLNIGFRFKCSECGKEHEFVQRQWGYGLVEDFCKKNR
jgi:hypothetical protein